ncbi:IclR family transcriptional regulator [Acidiferrimicrobium sp. IK]|uniref:IclR family transcriptional regulator n=1 Tax=Acidiferrimicrobium sp. IK TaxID=2871700 RepID=UPI0021CB6739|nr:IclR family transcriptional regulator [Acidiferrimicrobium sp. IK]MCU4184196.1 IclR family transcriptional regulator [Acidiferrimicrobium sp. IK]
MIQERELAPSAQPVSVLDRISRIVAAFDAATPSLCLNELTDRCGLPKSTVHRVAEQLLEGGWLERTPLGYRLGTRFYEVGSLVAARTPVKERALPWLHDLQAASGHTVHLGVLEGDDVLVIDKVWGHRAPSLPSRIGGRLPVHCTALGKSLLGFSGADVQQRVLRAPMERFTGRTTTAPYILEQQLVTARTTHWTLDDEEHAVGVRCVAAPIRGAGRAIAAVSVSGPAHTLDISQCVPLVRRCAADIWSQLFRREQPPGDHDGADDTTGPWDVEKWRRWLDGVAGEWM